VDWFRALPWLALFSALALFGGGVLDWAEDLLGAGDAAAGGRVVRVVDGDTVRVRIDGDEETVRYIGVDTPETKKPNTPVQCFGPEASDFTKHALPEGTDILVVRDIEGRDDYGRLLGYVYRAADGMFVNLELASDGFARPLTIAPNDAHAAEIVAAARAAEAADVGLWGACRG
jgi:endonuclease YncB( thermonuclease family)